MTSMCVLMEVKVPHTTRLGTKTKKTAVLVFFCIICNHWKGLHPVWYPEDYRLTLADYIEVLRDTIIPGMCQVVEDYGGILWVIEQDGLLVRHGEVP